MTENQQMSETCKKRYDFFFVIIIRCLRLHFDELEIKLSEYEKQPPALVFITESWLSENDPLETFRTEAYHQLESKPRKSGIRGGVAFYARCDVEYEILDFETQLKCAIINAKIDDLKIKTSALFIVQTPSNS